MIICTIDIEKAFLQGLTVKEVADATGSQEEETHFVLPSGAGAMLRQIPVYEDFNKHTENLLALKASTGTVGALRAFSLKLARVTRGPPLYLRPLSRDAELDISIVLPA